VLELRRSRQTYCQIAQRLPVVPSTIARLLRRAKLHRLAELEPALPENRYEYAWPGQLLHLDIKKLGRIGSPGHRVTVTARIGTGASAESTSTWPSTITRGWPSSIELGERGISACKALIRTVRYYRSLGVCFERVLTDNGTCYRSHRFQRLVRRLGLRHLRTRPHNVLGLHNLDTKKAGKPLIAGLSSLGRATSMRHPVVAVGTVRCHHAASAACRQASPCGWRYR